MKKRFLAVCMIIGAAGLCWAQNALPGGIMLGSRVELERLRNGGGGEVGYVFASSSGFRSMGILQVSGYGTSVDGMGEIAGKLTFGGVSEYRYHTYGFVRGGICFSGNPDLAWDVSGGGGFEIFASKRQAFFVEMGGGFNWRKSPFGDEEGYGGYAFIAPGLRHYF